jgi:hypothetical protein
LAKLFRPLLIVQTQEPQKLTKIILVVCCIFLLSMPPCAHVQAPGDLTVTQLTQVQYFGGMIRW